MNFFKTTYNFFIYFYRKYKSAKIYFKDCELHLLKRMKDLLEILFSSVELLELNNAKQLDGNILDLISDLLVTIFSFLGVAHGQFVVIMAPLEKSKQFAASSEIAFAQKLVYYH